MCTHYRPTSRDLVREYLGQDIAFIDGEDFRAAVYPGHLAPIIRRAYGDGHATEQLECAGAYLA